MDKVKETMRVNEVLELDDGIMDVFLKNGLNCLGCPGAATESLAEAAEGHGVDLQVLLRDLNQYLERK